MTFPILITPTNAVLTRSYACLFPVCIVSSVLIIACVSWLQDSAEPPKNYILLRRKRANKIRDETLKFSVWGKIDCNQRNCWIRSGECENTNCQLLIVLSAVSFYSHMATIILHRQWIVLFHRLCVCQCHQCCCCKRFFKQLLMELVARNRPPNYILQFWKWWRINVDLKKEMDSPMASKPICPSEFKQVYSCSWIS